jgi:Fe2+ transport system protein FeoA
MRIQPVNDMLLPLESLRSGDTAEVEEIVGEQSLVLRLGELGLRAGSRFRVLREGLPCLLDVGGARLSLRIVPGLQVLVRTVALPALAVSRLR